MHNKHRRKERLTRIYNKKLSARQDLLKVYYTYSARRRGRFGYLCHKRDRRRVSKTKERDRRRVSPIENSFIPLLLAFPGYKKQDRTKSLLRTFLWVYNLIPLLWRRHKILPSPTRLQISHKSGILSQAVNTQVGYLSGLLPTYWLTTKSLDFNRLITGIVQKKVGNYVCSPVIVSYNRI